MTWSAELVSAAAVLVGLIPPPDSPLEALRQALAMRWDVEPAEVRFDPDSARMVALAAASGPLRVTGVLGDGRVLVVDAQQQHLWVRAGFDVPVPVAARDLPRGTTLDSSDIRIETQVAWGGVRPAQRVPYGWQAQRALRAGDVLSPPAVTPALAVRAGDDVRALWARGTVRLEVSARAAGTGAVGDTIAVRTAAGRRLQGVIRAAREVVLVGSGGVN